MWCVNHSQIKKKFFFKSWSLHSCSPGARQMIEEAFRWSMLSLMKFLNTFQGFQLRNQTGQRPAISIMPFLPCQPAMWRRNSILSHSSPSLFGSRLLKLSFDLNTPIQGSWMINSHFQNVAKALVLPPAWPPVTVFPTLCARVQVGFIKFLCSHTVVSARAALLLSFSSCPANFRSYVHMDSLSCILIAPLYFSFTVLITLVMK